MPHLVLHYVTFPQFLERHAQNRWEVEKHVIPAISFNEPEPSISYQLLKLIAYCLLTSRIPTRLWPQPRPRWSFSSR
jgi:hypothetical protein